MVYQCAPSKETLESWYSQQPVLCSPLSEGALSRLIAPHTPRTKTHMFRLIANRWRV